MKWKIYFGILLFLTVPALLTSLLSISSWNLLKLESFLETIVFILGTYTYTFQKKIFTPQIWKYICITIVIIWSIQLIAVITGHPLLSFARQNLESDLRNIQNFPVGDYNAVRNVNLIRLIEAFAYTTPALIAIYLLGFAKKGKKK